MVSHTGCFLDKGRAGASPINFSHDSQTTLFSKSGNSFLEFKCSELSPILACHGMGASLGFLEAVKKEGVVGNRLFDELFQQEKLGAIDNGMNALLKGLHGGEGLKRVAKKNHRGMAALTHGHVLQSLQREIFGNDIGGE
jgi:hypothetical protein